MLRYGITGSTSNAPSKRSFALATSNTIQLDHTPQSSWRTITEKRLTETQPLRMRSLRFWTATRSLQKASTSRNRSNSLRSYPPHHFERYSHGYTLTSPSSSTSCPILRTVARTSLNTLSALSLSEPLPKMSVQISGSNLCFSPNTCVIRL